MPVPFAAELDGLGMVVLGGLVLVTAFLMRRSSARSRKIRKRDVAAEVKHEFLQAEQKGRSDLDRLSVRLHDFVREVDALSQTRITMLRELTAAADRVIAELQSQLAAIQPAGEFSPTQRHMIGLLAEAGHSPAVIATLVNRPEQEVCKMIEEAGETDSESHAA